MRWCFGYIKDGNYLIANNVIEQAIWKLSPTVIVCPFLVVRVKNSLILELSKREPPVNKDCEISELDANLWWGDNSL